MLHSWSAGNGIATGFSPVLLNSLGNYKQVTLFVLAFLFKKKMFSHRASRQEFMLFLRNSFTLHIVPVLSLDVGIFSGRP